MFKNNKEKQTNERKSFKEFVSDNRGKIMIIGGTVVTITAGIILTKNYKNLAKNTTKTNAKSDLGLLVNNELWEKVTVTENIITNSGIIDQAKATITRKRDTLIGKLNSYENMNQINDDIKKAMEQAKAGITGYDKMLDQCDELEYLYKCRTIGENLLDE